MTTKYPVKCNQCEKVLENTKQAYQHKVTFYHYSVMANRTEVLPSLKRSRADSNTSEEFQKLLGKGVEALEAGAQKEKIISNWIMKKDLKSDVSKLLDKTSLYEIKWKTSFARENKTLAAELVTLRPSVAAHTYLEAVKVLVKDFKDNKCTEEDLDKEIKMLDYVKKFLQFGK